MSERKKNDKNWALNSTSEDNFKNQNSNIKIRKSKLKNKNALINKIKQQGGGGGWERGPHIMGLTNG